MDPTPVTTTALFALAFVLGARHGVDADHLATIDGITRCNARANPRLARVAGALFSLGHGAVVLLVAAAAGLFATRWQPPGWLEVSGAAVSTFFLFGLSFVNVRAVLAASPDAIVAPSGLKSRLLRRVLTVRRPWAIAAVGALFALSFDTLTQAVLFASAASRYGGVSQALLAAAMFVLGMLVVDGINSVWISALIRRADRTSAIASRVMALAVAAISFAVGVLTIAKMLLPPVEAWVGNHEPVFQFAIIGAVILGFGGAMHAANLNRRPIAAVSAGG